MRILLLGEFSGLYKNLKEGLQELGYDVHLAANGDGWKQIGGADISFDAISKKYCSLLHNVDKLEGYDIVQVINMCIFRRVVNYAAISILKRNNKKLLLSGAGDDYFVHKAYKDGKYRYYMLDSDPEALRLFDNSFRGKIRCYDEKRILKLVDGVIPIAYEYAEAYREEEKRLKTIPIPMNVKMCIRDSCQHIQAGN